MGDSHIARGAEGSALWPGRLLWRLRAALLWPLFTALTVLDAVLLGFLPIAGTQTGFVAGLLVAMFGNLVAVAALGRPLARVLRRRRPDMPRVVAEDRAGSALVLAVTAALLLGGVLHAPGRDAARRARSTAQEAARAYVLAHGAAPYRAAIVRMDTEQQGDRFFRTCVPGDPAAGVAPLCLLVDTSLSPPRVRLDHDRTPNRHG